MNRAPFGVGEWYHCYTRGVDKRRTFNSKADYRRFLQILYLANNIDTIHRSDLGTSHEAMFQKKRGKPLVSIAAYCIMPNHFHLVIHEIHEGGIAKFMQKIGTSYAMYFNIRNARVGNLFVKPFRSKHINKEGYWKHIAQYVHLNAAELFEPEWKKGNVRNMRALQEFLTSYEYSSLADYSDITRPEGAILNTEAQDLMKEEMPTLEEAITDATEYYRQLTI